MAYESEIEKLQRRYDEKPEQWFAALADAYRKANRLDDALDIVRVGIEDRPNYVSGHIVLGRCLVDRGEDAEARVVFERVLGLDAENIIALRMLADVSERQGDLSGAAGWLQRLLDIDPMNDEARDTLSRVEVEVAEAPPPEPPAEAKPMVVETAAEMAGVGSTAEEQADVIEPMDLDMPEEEPTADSVLDLGPEGTVKMSPPAETAAEEDRMIAEPPPPEPAEPPPPAAVVEAPDTGVPAFDLDATPPGIDIDRPIEDLDTTESPIASDPPPPAPPEPATPPSEPFVIRTADSPFGADESEPASFDAVLPENQGGVFGVNEIDFDSQKWTSGEQPSADDSSLPVGEQEISLDSFDTVGSVSLGDDVGMPVQEREISLDDFASPPRQEPPLDVPAEYALDADPGAPTDDLAPAPETDRKGEKEEVTQPIPAVRGGEGAADRDSGFGDLPEIPTETPELAADLTIEPAPELEPVAFIEPEPEPVAEPPVPESPPMAGEAWPEPSPGLVEPDPASTEAWPEPAAGVEAEEPSEAWPEPAAELAGGMEEAWPEAAPGLDPAEALPEETAASTAEVSEQPGGDEPTRALDPGELAAAIERTSGTRPPQVPPEPLPVSDDLVTETMAAVYARQGLISEARAVYEQLIEANPTDQGLRARLDELNARVAAEAEALASSGSAPSSYRASATGAMPVRAFLANVLAARPGGAGTELAVPETAAAAPPPPTPLEVAFGAGEDDDSQGGAGAADDTPLAAVFERETPVAPKAPADEAPAKDLSFDQFFRSEPAAEEGPAEEDKGDDEDFKAWLQGLKS